jgi:hypothetical protein
MQKLSIAFAAALVSAVSAGASAQWAVYDAQVARGVQSVVDALRNSGQVNAAVQSKATEQMANSVTDAHATDAMRRAERDYQIQNACGAIVGTRGATDISRVNDPNGTFRRRIGAPPGASPALTKAINIASGYEPPPPVSTQAELAVKGGCETFVNRAGVRGVACENSGTSPRVSIAVEEDADIKPETLFRGAARAGEVPRKKLTIEANDQKPEFYALAALHRNLFQPLQLRALSSSELQTAPGRQYTTMRDAYEARSSMASHPFDSFVQRRMENKATIGAIDQMLNSPVDATFVQNYLQANGLTEWRSRGISPDELENLEVERRYMNLEWHKNLASQPGDPVQKEMAVMKAYDQVMMLRLLDSVSRANVAAGQIASTLNRMEMTPQLNALHGAAVSSNR